MKALDPKLISSWIDMHNKVNQMRYQIDDRITFILQTWFKIYGIKLNYWFFDGALEGEVGDLYSHMNESTIHSIVIGISNNPNERLTFIDKNGCEYNWNSEIPTRWLTDDNFEKEIKDGKLLFQQNQNKKREELKEAKLKKEDLVKSALKKLTKQELAALKSSL